MPPGPTAEQALGLRSAGTLRTAPLRDEGVTSHPGAWSDVVSPTYKLANRSDFSHSAHSNQAYRTMFDNDKFCGL